MNLKRIPILYPVPIVTYILGTSIAARVTFFKDPTGYDLVQDKLIYLGSKGLFTIKQGLTIVYLSGLEELENKRRTNEATPEPVTFNLPEIENLEGIFEKKKNEETECVDILLTNQWPKYIEKQSGQVLDDNENSINQDQLVTTNTASNTSMRTKCLTFRRMKIEVQ